CAPASTRRVSCSNARSAVSSRSPPMSASARARICGCTSSASSARRRASTGAPSPGASSRPPGTSGAILLNHGDYATVLGGRGPRSGGGQEGTGPRTRPATSGWGRIGRSVPRALLERDSKLEIAAVTALREPATLARLLAFDTTAGRLGRPVSVDGNTLV